MGGWVCGWVGGGGGTQGGWAWGGAGGRGALGVRACSGVHGWALARARAARRARAQRVLIEVGARKGGAHMDVWLGRQKAKTLCLSR